MIRKKSRIAPHGLGWLLAALLLCLAATALAAAPLVYHGNAKTHKFHRPGCRHYHCKQCVVVFHSREEAVNAGYDPCQICRP